MTCLGEGLPVGLGRWRAPRAMHGPGKITMDLAGAVALGGAAWSASLCCGRSHSWRAADTSGRHTNITKDRG